MCLNKNKRIVVGICGASGAVYGVRCISKLLTLGTNVSLIVSDSGKKVMAHELKVSQHSVSESLVDAGLKASALKKLSIYENDQFFSPPASGSFRHDGMVIVPCSMGTLAAVAGGLSSSLMHRAADVALKERLPLLLVTRETPLSLVHIDNMADVTRAGGVVLPASPSFYFHPQTIDALVDSVVDRILHHLGIECGQQEWG